MGEVGTRESGVGTDGDEDASTEEVGQQRGNEMQGGEEKRGIEIKSREEKELAQSPDKRVSGGVRKAVAEGGGYSDHQ